MIGLIPSEPLRERMGGIGIRYMQLARHLHARGHEVLLVTPGDPALVPPVPFARENLRRFSLPGLGELLAGCRAVITQGQLANDVVLAEPRPPVVIDLYDPWLVENFAYAPGQGLEIFRNDLASWTLQLQRGDFFLCSSELQRTYYLGFLTALGRVHPELVDGDPDCRTLIAPVPFLVEEALPEHRVLLPPRGEGERRVLFGGVYDWYDPWTLLEALERLDDPEVQVLFVRTPNPETTPGSLLDRLETRCRELGWLGRRARFLDWAPADRRHDLLRDVDVMTSPHRGSLESGLSLRTRYLEALAVGCPVIATAGGAISDLLERYGAGEVVPPRDPAALAAALGRVLARPPPDPAAGAAALLEGFRPARALAPLLAFLEDPAAAPWSAPRPASAPARSRGSGLRGWLQGLLSTTGLGPES